MPTSSQNPEISAPALPTPATPLQLALSAGGGYFPQEGCFSSRFWAMCFGTTDRTIRNWIDKYDIPFIQPGDEMYVDAADMRTAFPKRRKSTAKPPRGGSRKGK